MRSMLCLRIADARLIFYRLDASGRLDLATPDTRDEKVEFKH
jgi:hypothetical protein